MKKILIVDDDPNSLSQLNSFLLSNGYSTEITLKWEETYKKALGANPDLIIIESTFSGINGGFISRYLKQSEHTRNIPVIMISVRNEAMDSAEKYGAADVISKPLIMSDLLSSVRKLI